MAIFFASAGRMGRAAFVAAIAVVIALLWADERFIAGGWRTATGWLADLILVFAAASVLAKRLHDRSRSGWWAAPILLAFVLAWPWPHGALGWLGAAGIAVAAVDLALLPGEQRFNRFGPPPAR